MTTRQLTILGLRSLAAALVLVVAGCVDSKLACRDCNVVFVLLDTVRADHLSSYGYPRQTTPRLDGFGEAAIRFPNVRSQAACTFPSVNSLLTSRYPSQFFDPEVRPAIPEGIPTLAQLLASAGWTTAAVSASPIVRTTPSKENPQGGFGAGFARYDESCLWNDAVCVNHRARDVLTELTPPFLLYLHYMDAHDPYQVPARVPPKFAGPPPSEQAWVIQGDPNPLWNYTRDGTGPEPTESVVRHFVDRYDDGLHYLDSQLGALFDQLQAAELWERTLVVVASDHGESFLDHGQIKHCNSVHDAETKVPLFLHIPGVEGPLAPANWVQNLDIVPTVLDYLEVDLPESFDGRSLRALIEGTDDSTRLAFSSQGRERALNDERHQLIYDAQGKSVRLYDLSQPSAAQENLAPQQRDRLRALLRPLRELLAETEPDTSDADRDRVAEEIEKELRSLGYFG